MYLLSSNCIQVLILSTVEARMSQPGSQLPRGCHTGRCQDKKLSPLPQTQVKSRDVNLPTNACIVKAMVFPVVMYGCEGWTIKKAKHQRTNVFELWCWRRLLRVPWTIRRSNQSSLKEINPEYSLKGLTLKLKLQYFVHLMPRADSLEKTLMLGNIEGRRRRG